MNFLEQQQELSTQLGLDLTQSDTATRIKRWLNMSQRLILGYFPWPFLRSPAPTIIQTVPDITTGTVSTTLGSTSITFSSGPSVSVTGYYVQFSDTNDWYQVTAHTAGQTIATITPSAITTNGTSSYTLRKVYYTLDSDVDRVLSARQNVTPYYLTEMSKEQFDSWMPSNNTTGIPRVYMLAGKDSSDQWQVVFWPTPSSKANIQFEFLQKVDDLSGDSDVSIIPSKWNATVMIEGAKMFGYDFLDDSRKDGAKVIFYKMLDDMKAENTPSKNTVRQLRGVEYGTQRVEFPYPSNYPAV